MNISREEYDAREHHWAELVILVTQERITWDEADRRMGEFISEGN